MYPVFCSGGLNSYPGQKSGCALETLLGFIKVMKVNAGLVLQIRH